MNVTSTRLAGVRLIGAGRSGLLAMTGAALLAICLVFAFVMAAWHRDVARSLGASGESMAGVVAHEIDRNIELLDLSIRAVSTQWESPDVRNLPAPVRDMVLFDSAMRAAGFGAILVIDRNGRIAASSPGTPVRDTSLADRDYFRVHIASGGLGLFVSKPFVSRLSGRWTVALTRRMEDASGAFDGVVLGSIDLAYLSRLYANLGVGPDRAVTLFRTDGTVITREPAVDAAAHVWVGGDDAFTVMRSSRAGTFEGASPIDGRRRIMSFHRVGNLPMIQSVEVGGDDDYATWWRRAAAVAGLLTLLCLCVLVLCLALHRELGRRTAAEEALSRLAGTDPLTGLANRRSFDAASSAAWSRATAPDASAAMLMVDADAFKAYNDVLGHEAGDVVLRQVAGCLQALASRHGGEACRWGGEEFAVLLPGLDEGDALLAAESLCQAVRDLELAHPAGAGGRVTVSVGVAATCPAGGGTVKALLADADAALYRAKREGRDCARARPLPRAVVPLPRDDRRRTLS